MLCRADGKFILSLAALTLQSNGGYVLIGCLIEYIIWVSAYPR